MTQPLANIQVLDEATGKTTQLAAPPGRSLLAIAADHGIHIEHTCGGVGACATCHVRVLEGAQHLSEPTDSEYDQLEQAPGYSPQSRLACQAIVTSPGDIRCIIPKWNRNLVKEGQ